MSEVRVEGVFDLYVDDGGGEKNFGTVKVGSITAGKKTIEFKDGLTGLPTERYLLPPDVKIKATLQNFETDVLDKLFHTTRTAVSSSTQTVTGESVTVSGSYGAGNWVSLAYGRDGISSVTVKDKTDTTTYTENTDYVMDYEDGRIARISGGAITDGQELHVSYTYNTQTGYKITIPTSIRSTTFVVRLSHETMAGKTITIKLWKATVTADVEWGFNLAESSEIPVEFSALKDSTNGIGYIQIET